MSSKKKHRKWVKEISKNGQEQNVSGSNFDNFLLGILMFSTISPKSQDNGLFVYSRKFICLLFLDVCYSFSWNAKIFY